MVITGIDRMDILDHALEAIRMFEPMTPAQVAALLARTAGPGAEGAYELFETSSRFDGTAHNPEWLG
jgi:uncharacterized protein